MRPCSEPRWSRLARCRFGRRRKEPKDDGGRRRKHGREEGGKRAGGVGDQNDSRKVQIPLSINPTLFVPPEYAGVKLHRTSKARSKA